MSGVTTGGFDSNDWAGPSANRLEVVPGRECGSCTLCCKVYNIPEIQKAAGKWCGQCKPGRGCKIHDSLPQQCAEFNCLWRTDAAMPAQWKPDQAKMVVTIHPISRNIHIQVDPGLPSAWSRQPYHDHLRQWATKNMPKGMSVVVFVNELATLVLPDQDVPLGPNTGADHRGSAGVRPKWRGLRDQSLDHENNGGWSDVRDRVNIPPSRTVGGLDTTAQAPAPDLAARAGAHLAAAVLQPFLKPASPQTRLSLTHHRATPATAKCRIRID